MPFPGFDETAAALAATGRAFHARGWAPATSGNYSAVLSRDPLRLAVSVSGTDKGTLEPAQFVTVDDEGRCVSGSGRPSDETGLHLAVVRARGAGAVLHTHSVWATVLSQAARGGEVVLSGLELLKGLSGVKTHEHVERVPVIGNTQDYGRLSDAVASALAAYPECHGLLLRGHGLYAWGADLAAARRHVEALEFLFEVAGRLGGRT
ncbi:MAG TPA: methylthioribulose 1-phosphate dehydratase [Vicinamibacteria bacterium]|nr:methylthioribulose 1-phosphate dehydratase [Vicinamibacteria bacterium]